MVDRPVPSAWNELHSVECVADMNRQLDLRARLQQIVCQLMAKTCVCKGPPQTVGAVTQNLELLLSDCLNMCCTAHVSASTKSESRTGAIFKFQKSRNN